MNNVIKNFQLQNLDNISVSIECKTSFCYETEGSSGIDLPAFFEDGIEEIILKPFTRELIPTGIKILDMGSPFIEAQIRSRSGWAVKQGIVVLNSPGTIDSDYRGEIKVLLINFSNDDVVIKRYMRIAQLVFVPIIKLNIVSNSFKPRNEGGFGSTGI